MKEDSLELDQSIDSTMKDQFLRSDTYSQCGNFNISTSDILNDLPLSPPKENLKAQTIDTLSKKLLKTAYRKSQPSFSSIEGTITRLLTYEKRKQEKLEVQVMLSKAKEKKTMKDKPSMCVRSKQLNEAKTHIPIYSQERINQIEQVRKEKLEKIKKEITEQKEETEKKILESEKEDRLSKLSNTQLCFNPNAITSMILKNTNVIKAFRKTSEDEELSHCSFRPKTNKKSIEIAAKINTSNKPVVQRLLDYDKSRKYVMQQKMKDNKPSFKPEINNKTKKGILHKDTKNSS